jgi:hypothetical protein
MAHTHDPASHCGHCSAPVGASTATNEFDVRICAGCAADPKQPGETATAYRRRRTAGATAEASTPVHRDGHIVAFV